MNKCPHCGKEVDELRGDCPHCQGDLNAEGLRQLLLEQKTTMGQTVEQIRAAEEENQRLGTRMDELEQRLKDRKLELALGGDQREDRPEPISIGNVIRACINKSWDGYDKEREACEIGAERWRALSTQSVGTGGAIIPPEYLPQEMIELLRAKIIVESLGARVLSNLSGSPVTIPRLAGGATAYHVAENTGKTPSDQNFEELSLTPHEVAAATIYSKRMALMSNPSVDNLIQDDLLAVLALSIDFMSMFGTGAANQPVGIINTAGISTYTLNGDGGNGAIPIPTDVDQIQYTLEATNSNMQRLGWAFHPRTKTTFKSMRDESGGVGTATGGWLFRQDIKEGNLDGHPFGSSTQIPINITKGLNNDCSYIIFADWNDLVLAYWGGLEVATSDQAEGTFLKNQVIIKVSMLYDIGLRHPETFVVTDGVRG